jgi:OPA family glycerol-3-phosphate transporter-like MFS transporter
MIQQEASISKTNAQVWTKVTLALMIVGYAGYYICRSDLSVARTQIIDQYKNVGITKESIGLITAIATGFYAFGKFLFGSLADILGGRRMFLLGMVGAIVCTLVFGVGGPPMFLIAWCGNRLIQASGWVGMIKITSRWYSHRVYGTIMGLVSLSFLFGDFLSRQFLGALIHDGYTWQQVFYVSAATLGIILVPTWLFIRNSPEERGLPEPEGNPESVFATVEDAPQRQSALELIKPLCASKAFWAACALSFGFTFMRETFNDWIPTYLHEVAKMDEGAAASASSYFPLFGGFSVIGVGYLSDRMKRGGRAAIIAIGLALSSLGIFALANARFGDGPFPYIALTAFIAFVMIGPYSFLAGAISLDFGGKQASATAAGWIDGIGYIGGILSGYVIGKVAEQQGWQPALQILAFTALISCFIAIAYWRSERALALDQA